VCIGYETNQGRKEGQLFEDTWGIGGRRATCRWFSGGRLVVLIEGWNSFSSTNVIIM